MKRIFKFILIKMIIVCIGKSLCSIEKLCQQRTAFVVIDQSKKENDDTVITILPSNNSDSNSSLWCTFHQFNQFCYRKDSIMSLPTTNEFIRKKINDINRIGFMQLDDTMNVVVHDYFFRLLDYIPIIPHAIESLSPPYGAIVSDGILDIQMQQVDSFHVELNMNNGQSISEFPPPMNFVFSDSHELEPRSLFYSLTPIVRSDPSAAAMRGLPHMGYIEVVLPDDEIQRQRQFVQPSSSQSYAVPANSSSPAVSPLPDTDPAAAAGSGRRQRRRRRIGLCIWGPRGMDGQKRIWMQQAELLDRDLFRVSWILDPDSELRAGQDGPLAAQLRLLRPPPELVASPFSGLPLPLEDLLQHPPLPHWRGVPQEQFAAFLAAQLRTEADYDLLYRFAHDRLRRSNFSLPLLTPRWCAAIFEAVAALLRRQRCDVLVFGNSRGFSSNVVLTDAARLLGLPSVAELVNLHLHPDIVPAAIVAPSSFALTHSSVSDVLQSLAGGGGGAAAVRAVVIPPAVDLRRFDPARPHSDSGIDSDRDREADVSMRRLCGLDPAAGSEPVFPGQTDDFFPCILIGFVGRLDPEKSPGLFLQAAYEILQRYPYARFLVLGDGSLGAHLRELAVRLGMQAAVLFAGMVAPAALPSLLRRLHMVVNPSLIYETFCISNIEAMSMQLPLITFAVGGIGEYVAEPGHSDSQQPSSAFSVAANAVVVNSAQPKAIAAAAHFLIEHPEVRLAIGRAARRTVESFYSVERQMRQYEELYSSLVPLQNP